MNKLFCDGCNLEMYDLSIRNPLKLSRTKCMNSTDCIENFRKKILDFHFKWINIHDRLPEYGQNVLLHCKLFEPVIGSLKSVPYVKGNGTVLKDIWYIDSAQYIDNDEFTEDDDEFVSHWMPLPEKPE